MTREKYIKDLIKSKGMNLKEFATSIDIPYSTLLTILNGSIGGTAVDTVIKICKGLDIAIIDLERLGETEAPVQSQGLSQDELTIIQAARASEDIKEAFLSIARYVIARDIDIETYLAEEQAYREIERVMNEGNNYSEKAN